MKKIHSLIASLLAVLAVGALCFWSGISLSLSIEPLLIYVVCLFICPILGLIPFSRFALALFRCLFILLTCGGNLCLWYILPAFSVWGYSGVLLSALMLGTLLIQQNTCYFSAGTGLLIMRGVPAAHARRITIRPHVFAFFFKYSGLLMSYLVFWTLLFRGNVISKETVLGGALYVVAASLVGNALYMLLGAPTAKTSFIKKRKFSLLFSVLLLILVLFILLYIFIGYNYITEPILFSAMPILQSIVMAAFVSAFAGWLSGFLLGLVFAKISVSFFGTLAKFLADFRFLPLFIYLFIPVGNFLPVPYAAWLCLALPTFFSTLHFVLNRQQTLASYRGLPIAQYTKYMRNPLVTVPCLKYWIFCLIQSLYMAVFIYWSKLQGTIAGDGIYAVSALCLIAFLLFSAYLLVKEDACHE